MNQATAAVVTGYRVMAKKRGANLAKAISRHYHVKQSAEHFANLAMKTGEYDLVWVSDVIGTDGIQGI